MDCWLYFPVNAKERKARRGGIVVSSLWDVASFFLLLTVFRFSQSLVCRKCENAYSLDECSNNITCNSGELCFMDETVINQSAVVYSAGCRLDMICSLLGGSLHSNGRRREASSEIVTCSRCCDSDDCNSRLCGIRNRNSTSSQCYYCDSSRSDAEQGDVLSGEECQHITTCQPNEACGVQHNFQGDQQHKERYTCMQKLICRLTTQEALRRLDECATNPNPLICGNSGRRRSAAGTLGDLNYNGNLSEQTVELNSDRHFHQEGPIEKDVSYKKAEVHVSKRVDSTCSACCGDGLCNSGTCDEVLQRLYHLWKENVLDFQTLSLKVVMPTVHTTTTIQTTTPTPQTTTPTTTTHPTTSSTHPTTSTTHPTTSTTHPTTSTTHPTTSNTHPTISTTHPTTSTTHPTTSTTHPTTSTTHPTPSTSHPTTSTTHPTTPTTHPTTPTLTTSVAAATCSVILHCKQGHYSLDHEPVCDVCEAGYYPVKQNTSCFDLSSHQGSICKTPDHCFKIFTDLLNWKDAKDVCTARGGNLFVPESLDEELFMEGSMNAMTGFTDFAVHMFWIGGHIKSEASWLELKGIGIERWAIDFSLQTECAAFSGPDTFRWKTLDCFRPSSFICKETKPYIPHSGASLIG